MGSHLYVAAQAPSKITVETVADAARERWPGIRLYPEEDAERKLGFFAPVDGDQVDSVFFEDQQFMTVELGEAGAKVGEWFLRLAPEDVQWVVFTEQRTEAVPVPSRATARQLLDAVHWPRLG
jgi:hypothetical protein